MYLGTGQCAVHDGVAAVQREGVLQLGQAFLCELISRVDHPAVGLGKQGYVRGATKLLGQSSTWAHAKPWECRGKGSFHTDTWLLSSLVLAHLSRKVPNSFIISA